MNYYEHHLGDYLRDTAHLTLIEDGAYRRLIDLYYTRKGPLPADPKNVCRLVRAHGDDEIQAVSSVLAEFFTLTDEGYRHKRCDAEIVAFNDKVSKKRAAANARWRGCDSNADAYAGALQMECSPDSIHQTPDKKPRKARKTPMPEGFALTGEMSAYVTTKIPDASPDGLFEQFCGQARAKGWEYVDWGQAFQTYVRNVAPDSGHWSSGQFPRGGNGVVRWR